MGAVYGVGYNRAKAITPHDSTDIDPTPTKKLVDAIYVGGAGNAVVVLEDGTAVTFNGLNAGDILPVRARRVNSTNTTATAMVALWMA